MAFSWWLCLFAALVLFARRILPYVVLYGNSAAGIRAKMIGILRASPREPGFLS